MNHPEFKAKIFTPVKGMDWRINSFKLMNGGYILFLLIALIASNISFSIPVDYFIRILLLSILGLILYASFRGAHEKEKKNGKLEGDLEINLDTIKVNNFIYSWNELGDIKFNVLQVLDEPLWLEIYPIARYFGGPAYSQGVSNFIEFKTSDKSIKVFFQLETPSHKVEIRRIMRLLFFNNRIDLPTIYNGLHLEYEEIQEFKKLKIKYLEDQKFKLSS